jgi:uracil-DNA glycosylase
MEIKSLFLIYSQQTAGTPDLAEWFTAAGMTNRYAELDFGFFPIGSGIFTSDSAIEMAAIPNCKVMVLGNDFGTVTYLETQCPNRRESENNATIKNLLSLDLDKETTFFTNLYLGLRTSGKNTDAKTVPPEYQRFCFEFFQQQLNVMNPRIVLCLGKAVMQAMSKFSPDFALYENASVSKLYRDDSDLNFVIQSGGRTFIFIPHPSYAHINWSKNDVKNKINEAIKLPVDT